MRACILIRHGATDMAGRFCGHSDPPLNDTGRSQIERAASILPIAPQVVYTSDLLRARESAESLAGYFSAPLIVRPSLREICFGEWEGLSWQEVEQRFPRESAAWLERFPAGMVPSGERYDSFVERVKHETGFLTSQAQSRALMAVTHGGFIRTALTEIYRVPTSEAFRLTAEYGAISDLSRLHLGVA
jgi:broad specificity phosphatase PhoE